MGGVVITHAEGSACRIKVLAKHQSTSLLEPYLLLKLQRRYRCNGFELMVKAGDAHDNLLCGVVDSKLLVKVFS